MSNDTTRCYAEYAARLQAAEDERFRELERQSDFARRRADPMYVKYGVDECSASGSGHMFRLEPQLDNRHYCEYCGAEAMPEDVKEWES